MVTLSLAFPGGAWVRAVQVIVALPFLLQIPDTRDSSGAVILAIRGGLNALVWGWLAFAASLIVRDIRTARRLRDSVQYVTGGEFLRDLLRDVRQEVRARR